jgi:hypothetical protein
MTSEAAINRVSVMPKIWNIGDKRILRGTKNNVSWPLKTLRSLKKIIKPKLAASKMFDTKIEAL